MLLRHNGLELSAQGIRIWNWSVKRISLFHYRGFLSKSVATSVLYFCWAVLPLRLYPLFQQHRSFSCGQEHHHCKPLVLLSPFRERGARTTPVDRLCSLATSLCSLFLERGSSKLDPIRARRLSRTQLTAPTTPHFLPIQMLSPAANLRICPFKSTRFTGRLCLTKRLQGGFAISAGKPYCGNWVRNTGGAWSCLSYVRQ